MNKIDQETLEKIQSEVKGSKILYEATILSQEEQDEKAHLMTPFEMKVDDFSSYSKVLRITAYATRFIQKLKKNTMIEGVPTPEEIDSANAQWIKYLQRKHFLHKTHVILKINKSVEASQLNPKLDDNGIIRCYGRFTNSGLPQDTITPILLPAKERMVHLLIEDFHKKLQHVGVNHTLSQIRTKFWILKGRAEVKFVLKKMQNLSKISRWAVQNASNGTLAKKQNDEINTIQEHWIGLLWTTLCEMQ